MGFYDLSKEERQALVQQIDQAIRHGFKNQQIEPVNNYFADDDTYIRKAGYLAVGKIHKAGQMETVSIVSFLELLLDNDSEKVRQTVINAAGEVGKRDFESVKHFFDQGLFDNHHSVRNAVIGSIKKMGEKNPEPILHWAKKYLKHPDKEVRREICHGIELRGRTHPQDILPLLEVLQHDPTARVRNTLIHVIGQIAYKKGCLPTVITALNSWKNKGLVEKALDEIVDVHHRYKNFAVLSQTEAIAYIGQNYDPK
ncbi:HEAT repeat domain-containing protein [Flagellimonas flava]|uniref:HEAT repeat domain-containing protein n=1 Tax=Flagellimonas flava TaxID=570519 RepID=UPI003D65DDCE